MRRNIQAAPGRRTTPHRCGISLIELIVLVSLMAVVAGTSCVLIASMIQTNRNQGDTLVRRRTMHLWQTQFQQDGRLAQSARIDAATPETRRIEFQLPEGVAVSYQANADGLERQVNGKLAGRWECGRGTWEFSLLEKDRIARAEFHRFITPPIQADRTMTVDSSHSTPGVETCVDVALATGLFPLNTRGTP